MPLRDDQIDRYARHLILPEIGGAGQQKLLGAKVLVVGAGGLGAPVLMYLAAAGVGTLGIVDDDQVDLSNLQRQVIHTTRSVGIDKVDSAASMITALNSDVSIIPYKERLNQQNAAKIIQEFDIVGDGTDNFETRFFVNDACYHARVPLVSGAVGQFDGQVSTFKGYEPGLPCYRCFIPEMPEAGSIPTCAEAGVLGALTGVIGSLQALEVIKEITGAGESLAGKLLIYDGLDSSFRTLKLKADPACPLCSDKND